jgi:hypothetical protein
VLRTDEDNPKSLQMRDFYYFWLFLSKNDTAIPQEGLAWSGKAGWC